MRWLDDISENKLGQTLEDGDGCGQGGEALAYCSPRGCKELDMTGQLNNSSLICINIITFTSFKLRIQMN